MLWMVPSKTGTREKGLARSSSMNCSTVVLVGTATISGRGFMASRTVFSPNSTTDWIRSRLLSSRMPSSWPASMSASTASAWVSGVSSECSLVSAVTDCRNPSTRVTGSAT